MKTIFKIIAGIGLLLVLAFVCVALYVRFLFDPNDLRDQITKQVQDKTGRELIIEGDLKISTFPWVSASIGRTTLSDDPAYSSEPMLTFESVSASVKFLPLLRKQLELGTTSIDGGRINLVRLADGTTNWNVLINEFSGDTAADEPETGSFGFETRSLGAIAISDATVVFRDQLPSAEFDTLTLSGFNLATGELRPGKTFGVDMTTRLDAARVGLDVAIEGVAELNENWLGFEDSRIALKGSYYAVPFEQFEVELVSDMLKVGETTVEMGAGSIDWTVSGGREGAKDLTSGSGSVNTSGLNASGDNFTLANPKLDFSFDFGSGSLKSFKGALNGSAMTQTGKVLEFKQPVFEFDAQSADKTVPNAVGEVNVQALTLADQSDLAATKAVVTARLSGDSIPGGPQKVTMNLDKLALNLDNGAMDISQYSVEGFDLKGRGSLKGTNVLEAATMSGPFTVERFNLRTLMKKLDVDLDMADAKALSAVEGSADLRITPDGVELRDLKATFDQSRMTGFIKLIGKTPEVSLNIDKLMLDGYLSPPDNIDGQDRAVDTIELPAQTIRDLNLNGLLRVGSLNVGGLASTNVEVQLAASDGDVRLYPIKAQLYGGSYSGDVRVSARGEVPEIALNESFTNVDFGALSQELAGSQQISGRVTGTLMVNARGHNTRDLKASSDGSVSFDFKDGVLDGINVMETVRNIVAAFNKEPSVADQPNRTEFRTLRGTATISKGVLMNNDLKVDIPLMRITGKGTVDLNTKAIDYRVAANVVQEGNVPLEKELRFISDYTLPLVIGGTYEEPKVDATRTIADLAGQYAKKRLQDKLLEKLGVGGKDDQEPATDGTPAEPLTPEEKAKQEEEKLKDALDQKLKDKLKDIFGGV